MGLVNIDQIKKYRVDHPDAKEILKTKNSKRPYFQITLRTAHEPTKEELDASYDDSLDTLWDLIDYERAHINMFTKTQPVEDGWETISRFIVCGVQMHDYSKLKKLCPAGFDTDIYKSDQLMDIAGFTPGEGEGNTGRDTDIYVQCGTDDTVSWPGSHGDAKRDVDSDSTAFEAVMSVHGSKLKRFNQKVYAFDESSGLWKTGGDAFGIFMKWSCVVNFSAKWGMSCAKIHSAFGFAATLPADETYFCQAEEATLGKLLFRDAIWDIEKQCRLEFDPIYMFHARIDRDLPVGVDEEIKTRVRKILFEDPHPHAQVRSEFMKGLAVALTGRNPKRSLWFNLGRTATGKSTLIKSLGHTYGGYVDILAQCGGGRAPLFLSFGRGAPPGVAPSF
jgi:hypothetical protein